MKLIDLLVKELPKMGGWPKGIYSIHQSGRGSLHNASVFDQSSGLFGGKSWLLASDQGMAIVNRSQYESALAASDGWIEWGGGECPVDSSCLVDLKFRNGATEFGYGASAYYWENANLNTDIIAYRWHIDTSTRANDDRLEQDLNECIGASEAQVWGGVGLPPVGCDVEYDSFPYGWSVINIVARIEGATFIEWKSGQFKGADIIRGEFPIERCRPLRTEAERKREEAIQDLTSVICGSVPDTGMATAAMYAERVYDAGYRKENK